MICFAKSFASLCWTFFVQVNDLDSIRYKINRISIYTENIHVLHNSLAIEPCLEIACTLFSSQILVYNIRPKCSVNLVLYCWLVKQLPFILVVSYCPVWTCDVTRHNEDCSTCRFYMFTSGGAWSHSSVSRTWNSQPNSEGFSSKGILELKVVKCPNNCINRNCDIYFLGIFFVQLKASVSNSLPHDYMKEDIYLVKWLQGWFTKFYRFLQKEAFRRRRITYF